MRRLRVLVLAASAACASAPLQDADVVDLARADALVLEGCYDCLIDARDTYARVGVGRARPLVVNRLFETEILIALRERELVLDSSEAERRAEALLPELPDGFDGRRVVDLVQLVLPDAAGLSVTRRNTLRNQEARRELDVVATMADLEVSGLSRAVARYVSSAIDCSFNARPGRPPNAVPRVEPEAPLLVRYRPAICFQADRDTLEAVATGSDRFVEAGFLLGRARLVSASDDGSPGARELLVAAYERFPESPLVTYIQGHYLQIVGDCREALRYFDETLALEARHESAQLGRAVCQSSLARHGEAIASATELIGWQSAHIAEAYYWRAWNRHMLKALEAARADIEEARRREITGPILTLAGVIAYDQDDLPPAEEYLSNARSLSYGEQNCIAAWYLGLVRIKQKRYAPSSSSFENAMTCYNLQVELSELGLATMEARTNVDPAFKAAQIEGFRQAIKADRAQYYAAAFNVANQAAQAGDRARALTFLAVADSDPAREPQLAEFVRRLKEILGIGGA